MAFLDEIQGTTMYFHKAMAQEDSGDFVETVAKEVNVHVDNAHWKIVPIESVIEDTNILPSVHIQTCLVFGDIICDEISLSLHGPHKGKDIGILDN